MLNLILSFFGMIQNEEDGQGMVEYGLIIGLVVVAIVGAMAFLGPAIVGYFQDLADAI